MSNSQSAEKIIAAARETRRKLSDFAMMLQDEIDEINFEASREGRELNGEEHERLMVLLDVQEGVDEASLALRYVTRPRLEEPRKVAALDRRVKGPKTWLRDRLEGLKRFDSYASLASKILDLIAKIGNFGGGPPA